MKKMITTLPIVLFLLASVVFATDVCIDNLPPSAPSSLVIADSPYDADGNIILTWSAATDQPDCSGVDYYKIYRSNNSVNFILIGTSATISFNDNSSLPQGTYYYKVTAIDKVKINPHEGPAVSGSTTVGTAPATTTTIAPTTTTPSGGNGGSGGGSSGGGSSGTTTTIRSTTTTLPSGSGSGATTTTVPTNPVNNTTENTGAAASNSITGLLLGALSDPLTVAIIIILIAIIIYALWKMTKKKKTSNNHKSKAKKK